MRKTKPRKSPQRAKPAKPAKPAKVPAPGLVALSARTGRPLLRPRKGAQVHYAIVGARGALRRLTKSPQAFLKSDFESIDKVVKASGGKEFVLYEQLTARNLRDADGNTLYRTRDGKPVLDARGRRIPLKEAKLTGKPRTGRQRPVIYKVGRRVETRVQDFAYRALSPRQKVDLKLAKLVPLETRPKAYTEEIHLRGATIFDTVKNVKPFVSSKDIRKKGLSGLMVEGVVRVRSPQGELLEAVAFSTRVNALWNFSQLVSKEIRHALARVGYRFTSLATLDALQRDADDRPGKEIDLFRMGPVGRGKVRELTPIRPEGKRGQVLKKAPMDVSVSLRITGIEGRKKRKR